jgi:hypothetical protein
LFCPWPREIEDEVRCGGKHGRRTSSPSSLAARPAVRLCPGPRENESEVQYKGECVVGFFEGPTRGDSEFDCPRPHVSISTILQLAAYLPAPAGPLQVRPMPFRPIPTIPRLAALSLLAPSRLLCLQPTAVRCAIPVRRLGLLPRAHRPLPSARPCQGPSKGALAIAVLNARAALLPSRP